MYMHQPDVASKREFIAEFWRIRDPDPGTEENEAKAEFDRRVAFANQWFDPFGSCRGHIPRARTGKPVGWNTDRGRVFIVMGFPDRIVVTGTGEAPVAEDRGDLLCRAQAWRYERYRYTASFIDTQYPYVGDDTHPDLDSEPSVRPRRSISYISTHTEAMNRAKLDWLSWDVRGWTAKPFRFKADYTNEGIRIRVPVDRLSFEAAGDRLLACFEIKILIYRQKQKTEVTKDSRSFEFKEEDVLGLKMIEMIVPYQPKFKGPHLFDIVVGFKTSLGMAKFRDHIKKTF
jgi:GWxTD domain-containing protein